MVITQGILEVIYQSPVTRISLKILILSFIQGPKGGIS